LGIAGIIIVPPAVAPAATLLLSVTMH